MRKLFASLAAIAFVSGSAQAQVLDFEGIGDQVAVGNYYNGGGGANYGIEFFGNALALRSFADGCQGSGNFDGQPSGCSILFFTSGSATGMNRAAGFSTGFSLFYSAVNVGGSVSVFSGLNGTGDLLAMLLLPTTTMGGPGCSASFCPFVATGVQFDGVAQSIVFAGAADQIAFDDVTFGSVTPGTTVAPEPSTYALMAAGLAGIGGVARRRRK